MTSVALPLPATPPGLFDRERVGASIGAVTLVSLLAFEAMAVAAAMPAVAAALDGMGLYALAFGGMLATAVLGMVLAGWSCDRHGALRATVVGLVVFTAGLLLAGAAHGPQGMAWLVAGRIVQGLGGGMLGVALYVGVGQVVPAALHPRLFALFATAWVVPALVGPALAAALVATLGWRAVFLAVAALVPVAAVLLTPALARLPRPRPQPEGAAGDPRDTRRRIAWAAAAALGALVLHAAGQAGAGWLGLLALVAGLLVAGAAAQRLLPPGTLAALRGLPAVIALRGLLAAAFATAEVFIPLVLTQGAGWSLAQAGLALSAGAVLWSLGSAVQARIADAARRRRALQAGFGLVSAGLAVVTAALLLGWPPALLVAGWVCTGFGIGLGFPMLSVLTLALSPVAEQGRNASALQLADAVCCSAAMAGAGALVAAGAGHASVMALALLLALLGLVLSRRAFA